MNSDPEKVRQLVLPLWLAAAALAGWLAGSANAPGCSCLAHVHDVAVSQGLSHEVWLATLSELSY